jgi:hypothetical protein
MKTRYALALLSILGCNKPSPTARADVPATRPDAPLAASDLTVPEVPGAALLALRGSNLRKVLNLVAPGVPTRVALGQVAPGLSPGLGEHGVDIDPDAPFSAVFATAGDGTSGRIVPIIAWPIRPGMEVVREAQAGRGYRDAGDGLYEPTGSARDVLNAADGGAAASAPCWVARRASAGWLMLCGPAEQVRPLSRWLVRAASSAPANSALLDAVVRPQPVRQLLGTQLAALEAQDPRRHDAGTNRPLVAQYEAVHSSAQNLQQLFTDLSAAHAALVLNETSYHLRAEVEFANATGASTRAIVGSSVGQRAALDLLRRLPASATAYFATGFDVASLSPLLSEDPPDPRLAATFGPEMARFQEALKRLTGFRDHGQRAMGFIPAEGMSRIEIVRLPGAAAAIAALRTTATSVPRTPRPSGANPADQFAILPSPAGLPPGSLRLRLGPDPARLPPQMPAEMRAQYQRTVLLVPEGDTLVLVDALDPVARYREMQAGPHLAPTAPEDRAAVLHLTPAALISLLGAPPPADTNATDAIEGTLQSTRVGDTGARFELDLAAPVVAVNSVRDTLAALQAQQQQMMQQARQAQQQAAAAQRRMQQQGGRAVPPSPSMLPDPDFQLQPPR